MKPKYIIPRLPLAVRLMLFALLALLGVYIQLFHVDDLVSLPFLLSLLSLAAASLLLVTRSYRNKPLDLGFEDWRPASLKEFDRIRENLERTKKARLPFLYKRGFGILVMIIMLAVAVFFLIQEVPFPFFFFADAFIILFPLLFTGLVKLWTPAQLKMKMERMEAVLNTVQPTEKRIIITPYLRLDKDKEGRQIPEDLRLMVEPRRKPEDLVGAQLQVAINNGPNGAVPYMYAVFLCRGKGDTFLRIKGMKSGNFIKEPGGDDEYGYVVMRQRTGGGGYHTTARQCTKLFLQVREVLDGLA